ncbi:MAG: hypothetical protein ACPGJV_13705 [Bacteriovoracaceae bacterium]
MAKFFSAPVYLCSNCKKLVEEIESLYFVEETSPRAFCSEKCIEEFYFPLIDKFEEIKNSIREELGFEPDLEECLTYPEIIDQLYSTPAEIWRFENLLKEEIYTYIKKVEFNSQEVWLASMVLVFSHRPSFVLAIDVTQNEKILEYYRLGEKIEDMTPYYEAIKTADEEHNHHPNLEETELLKGQLLSEILAKQKPIDIQFEQFHLYDVYLHPTIENPDQITEWQDEKSNSFYVCSKAFEVDGTSFYYIVFCYPFSIDQEDKMSLSKVVPIFGFPTLDGDIYTGFTSGNRLSGALKN